MREADVPAEQPKAQEEARLPRPDADAWGSRGAAVPPRPRQVPALGLIWRVGDRETFRRLARVSARRCGPLSARFVADGSPTPRVAYAIGRKVGSAPVRNRLRRRLRAALRERAGALRPGSYLIGAGRAAVTLSPSELRNQLDRLLASTPPEPPPEPGQRPS